MSRQTDHKNYLFPDGFQLEISTDDGSTWTDIGIVAAGATATLNWDDFRIDAGNYTKLVNRARNFTCALAPSALWNWDPDAIAKVFDGIFTKTTASTPSAGDDLEFKGGDSSLELSDVQVRMTHYSDSALTTADWQFTLFNANIDAGASFNFKGVNEDGLDEITVSFTGRPDPDDGYKLMKLFKA
jgi:hypothetical protein